MLLGWASIGNVNLLNRKTEWKTKYEELRQLQVFVLQMLINEFFKDILSRKVENWESTFRHWSYDEDQSWKLVVYNRSK